jgi:hypothetical protein
MEITIWFLFLIVVAFLFLLQYLLKNLFFGACAAILFMMISFWSLSVGIQAQTGEITTSAIVNATTQTNTTYVYSDVKVADTKISDVIGVIGILISILFLAVYTLKMWGK